MPDLSTLAVFSAAALALIVVPGPAVLYVVMQGIDRGRIGGIVSAFGIAAGGLVHVFAAAVGISSLVVSSATAFTVVKWAGAAYLVALGLQQLLARGGHVQGTVPGTRGGPLRRVFWQGAVVNVLNPKTALFFLAFLPQFVDVRAGSVGAQAVVLGLVFVGLALVSDSIWGLAAGAAGGWLRRSRRVMRTQRYATGGVLVGLGLATALSGSRRN
jgi:threonine/homoserine/homoserine lactone efflux protein